MLFELCAGSLDEWSVLHARRADRFARSAIEALVHLLVEFRIEEIQPTVGYRLHQPEATARRGCLLASHSVGRTGRQTHSAMDARPKQIVLGYIGAGEAVLNHINE
jgi:hypothetical protein